MTGIDPRDRLPLLAAIIVMILGNVVGYVAELTIYFTVFAAPVAIVAFGVTRYVLHGSPYPMGVRQP
jgi:hypothetical protein